MKIRIILITFILGLFTSCEDNATDIVQPGTVIDDVAFETVEDLELGLNGVYNTYATNAQIRFNAVFTDNAKKGFSSNGQQQELFNFILNSNSGIAQSIWADRYGVINFANRVIEGSELIEVSEENQNEVDNILGQLIALRSIAYFDLLKYYTPDYDDPESKSAIYLDFVPDIDQELPRESVQNLFDFIRQDLLNAQELLNEDNGVSFVDKDVVKAYRAQLALYEGDNQLALDLSNELISKYPLADQNQYLNMFQNTDTTEVIWQLFKGQGDSQVGGVFFFNSAVEDADPYWEASNQLYNLVKQDNPADQDFREFVLFGPETNIVSENSEDNIIIINKYPGKGVGQLVNDIKMMRISEIYLIKAEAQARLTSLPDAAQTVKELRDARFATPRDLPTYDDLNDALTDILKERRIELAFEGQRYLDLKRLGGELNLGVTRNEVDCGSFSAPCALPRSSNKFTLPIPQAELNANSNIEQNPGY